LLVTETSSTLLLVTKTSPSRPDGTLLFGLTLRSIKPHADRQPGGRRPAPGALELVQAFVNTHRAPDRHDREQFDSPSALADWLVERDLLEPGTRLARGSLQRTLDVREGLRALLLANNGAEIDLGAVERLNRGLQRSGLAVELDPVNPPDFRALRRDRDCALAIIGTIVAVAQLDGSWLRFKACRAEGCGWAFYDHSRNQAGRWCSMATCGSRAKARDYRARN
jgi:predicted RNA-binding Zn ribbon-like protein